MGALFSWLSGVAGAPLTAPVVATVITGSFLVWAAIAGTQRAARIAADAQKEIATTNANSAQQIARINTDSAQKVEQIKADGQRTLEREKFHREWRRERVKPLQEQLEAARQENIGTIAGVLYIEDGTAQRATFPRARDVSLYRDLRGVCPDELQGWLQNWIAADSRWQPALLEWLAVPPEGRGPMSQALWWQRWENAETARLTPVRNVDEYVYTDSS